VINDKIERSQELDTPKEYHQQISKHWVWHLPFKHKSLLLLLPASLTMPPTKRSKRSKPTLPKQTSTPAPSPSGGGGEPLPSIAFKQEASHSLISSNSLRLPRLALYGDRQPMFPPGRGPQHLEPLEPRTCTTALRTGSLVAWGGNDDPQQGQGEKEQELEGILIEVKSESDSDSEPALPERASGVAGQHRHGHGQQAQGCEDNLLSLKPSVPKRASGADENVDKGKGKALQEEGGGAVDDMPGDNKHAGRRDYKTRSMS
jgi:hypothetical protein